MNKYDLKALLKASAVIGLYGNLIGDKRVEFQPIFDAARKLLEKETDQVTDQVASVLIQDSIEDLEWIVNKYAE